MRIFLGCVVLASAAGCWDNSYDDGSYDGGGGGGSGTGSGSGSSAPDPDDECPGADRCSPLTPGGLMFHGAVPVNMAVPNGADNDVHNHISSGGTDDIRIQVYTTGGHDTDLAYPFIAAADPPLHVTGTDGVVVHLLESAGVAPLHITDPHTGLLFDTYHYASSTLAHVLAIPVEEAITTTSYSTSAASSFAFWAGDVEIGVALLNSAPQPNRLVDTSAVIAVNGATQTDWDRLHFAAAMPGTYTATVASGGYAATTEIRVVDQVDDIIAIPTFFGIECFAARSQGAFIAHVPWTFTVDGGPPTDPFGFSLGPNCVFAETGQVIVATAGARTLTVAAALQ